MNRSRSAAPSKVKVNKKITRKETNVEQEWKSAPPEKESHSTFGNISALKFGMKESPSPKKMVTLWQNERDRNPFWELVHPVSQKQMNYYKFNKGDHRTMYIKRENGNVDMIDVEILDIRNYESILGEHYNKIEPSYNEHFVKILILKKVLA